MTLECFAGRLLNRMLAPDFSLELHDRMLEWLGEQLGPDAFTEAAALAAEMLTPERVPHG